MWLLGLAVPPRAWMSSAFRTLTPSVVALSSLDSLRCQPDHGLDLLPLGAAIVCAGRAMVIRLLVPPGEGQHKLVPKRPDAIGANATLQYSLLSSTFLAAAYASFAARYSRRLSPARPISTTALFVRSSARLGLWAGVLGAAVNVYYYTSFTNVVVLQKNARVKPWRLYKWTSKFTVEDGVLLGAGLGLVASIPSLLMRRLAISPWTQCLGLTHIGASAGVLGAHAYLQYTGERQKAYERYGRRLKRRSLEFWAIFWDKKLMALFDPLIQQYVRHNGIWYTHLLPDAVFEQPDKYGESAGQGNGMVSGEEQEESAYYLQPYDYTDDLQQINVQNTEDKMKELLVDREAYLRDAEYMLFINAQKQHDYCHFKPDDPDERQRRLQEIHLAELTYNRLRNAAHNIDVRLVKWKMSLQHKAIWCATERKAASADERMMWLPTSDKVDFETYHPSFVLAEMEKFQTQIAGEIKRFEELVTDYRHSKQMRDGWKKDLEDGRMLLRAADSIVFELQKPRVHVKSAASAVKDKVEQKAEEKTDIVKQVANVAQEEQQKPGMQEQKRDDSPAESKEKTLANEKTLPNDKTAKP